MWRFEAAYDLDLENDEETIKQFMHSEEEDCEFELADKLLQEEVYDNVVWSKIKEGVIRKVYDVNKHHIKNKKSGGKLTLVYSTDGE